MILSRFLRHGAAALALSSLLTLSSCKDQAASAPGTEGASPVVASTPGAGGAGASAAFDKPLKATGALSVRIVTNNASPFWSAADKGMAAGITESPETTAKRLTPSGASPTHADQKQTFEGAVAGGVSGIAVTPIDGDAFAPVIDAAIEKGVPVICFDSDSAKSKRLVYLGTNNYEAGKSAGEAALKLLPSGGKMVAFVGNMSAQNARDRYKGFVDATKGKITMLQDPFEDQGDANKGTTNAKDAITKYTGKIDGFLGLYSYNAPGIAKAVESAGLTGKVKIVAFDGDPQTLARLQNKTIDAAIVQKPYEFGRLSVKLLSLINRKGLKAALEDLKPELEKGGMKLDGNIIDTGVTTVTPENIGPFMENLKKLGLETT